MQILSRNDEILMLAILRLRDEACGVSIIQEVLIRTGKRLTFGSLWVSLDILFKRGLINKRMADPTPERGGRAKRFFQVEPAGITSVKESRNALVSMWEDLDPVLEDK